MKLKKIQFSPLLVAILNFCEKQKNINISETVRDRAISTEFLTHRVWRPLLVAILDFCGKLKMLISRKPQEIE